VTKNIPGKKGTGITTAPVDIIFIRAEEWRMISTVTKDATEAGIPREPPESPMGRVVTGEMNMIMASIQVAILAIIGVQIPEECNGGRT
jgi:hypothetical protein